ncbi:MAG: YfhO family protein [Candidatus Gastranaerophilales bacterium]|nr:YfhO family protein [Candidatus Gastranaerophilales bacterium]
MEHKKIKLIYSGRAWDRGLVLWLAFFLPTVISLCIFAVNGVYPFGDRSFLFSDMYHQYMPFFAEFLRAVKAGEGIGYSWNVGIGSNFLALYGYYLASPLHWLAFLVPESHLMEFMSYLVVVKIGLCGLSAAWYLQRHYETKDGAVIFFSSFYALSGFIAAYNWNIMWLDCVILLPVILFGLESLVKEGKCRMYCVALALSILTNFYISIMICIFLVLYFIALLIMEKRSVRIVVNFALYSLLAGGMAAVLLIPELYAILATDFGDVSFPETLESYFPVLDELARHCLAVTTERGLEHWPNIYCGTAVFLLLPMYALNKGIPIRRRFCHLALAGIFLFSFATNMADIVWHGMNYPDSLPARQSFIYILLVISMCYDAFRNRKETPRQQILYGYLAAVAFLLACEKFVESEDFDTGIEMLTLLFVTVYAVLLYLARTREERRTRRIIVLVTLVAVVTELAVNSINTSFGTTSRLAYLEPLEDYKALYAYVRQQDDGFYRMEKFTRKTKNDGTLAAYPTASLFSSTMNSSVMDMYRMLGMRNSKVYYGFDGATPLASALLNVNYMFGESDKYENPLYTLMTNSNEVYLYENQATLPFGYVAPVGFDFAEEGGNPILVQNRIVSGLGVAPPLFVRVSSQSQGDDVCLSAEQDGLYYALLTTGGTKKVDVVGGELELESYSDLKADSILYLGYLMKGDKITLTNGDEEDETPKITVNVYRLNEKALTQALAALSERHLENVAYDSSSVSGEITLTEAGRLILSVPYEKGWTVLVNGEETPCELFGGCLIALDLEPGSYRVELRNVPAGKYLGIGVSIVCAAVFVALEWYKKRRSAAAVN